MNAELSDTERILNFKIDEKNLDLVELLKKTVMFKVCINSCNIYVCENYNIPSGTKTKQGCNENWFAGR